MDAGFIYSISVLRSGRVLADRLLISVPQPECSVAKHEGYGPLKISSLRNGNSANLLKYEAL